VIGRIVISDVEPVLECGRRPAKAVVGETFEVSAIVIREGHEVPGVGVVLRGPAGERLPLARMREIAPGTDRYGAEVTPSTEGSWRFHVEAWGDPIGHWQHDAGIKVPRGQDVELMLTEGAALFDRAARSPTRPPAHRAALAAVALKLSDRGIAPWDRLAAADAEEITEILDEAPLRELLTRSAAYPLVVHRQRALYGAWYEFFPRSEGVQIDPMGRREPVGGTLRTAACRLDGIADMGFDVVYLPPIHPIGTTARKGRNNALHAGPGDPGSPWAIGSPDGGHD
jgi:starch synthase (maltosyl-transferring)